MIPQFPDFKDLEITDRKEIEKFASFYSPYSDFNFLVSWTWASLWDPKVSILNKNLVFRWEISKTKQPIYSYLGQNSVTDTIDNLYKYIDESGELNGELQYIPEISLKGIDFTKYFIEIDIDASDYIYDLGLLSSFPGKKLNQKRGRVNHFKLNNPTVTVKELDLQNLETRKELFSLNDLWKDRKSTEEIVIEGEEFAMQRLFELYNKNQMICIGIYDKKLVGYAIYSFQGSDFAINHFIKADIAYKGIYEFIMQESAIKLLGKGYKFLNYLEDLGDEGIRRAKMAYRPTEFLKKYKIIKL